MGAIVWSDGGLVKLGLEVWCAGGVGVSDGILLSIEDSRDVVRFYTSVEGAAHID